MGFADLEETLKDGEADNPHFGSCHISPLQC